MYPHQSIDSFHPTSKDSLCRAHGRWIGSMHLYHIYWKIKNWIYMLGTPPSAIDRRASGVKWRGTKTQARRWGRGTPRRVATRSQAKSGGANPSEELRSVVKRRMAWSQAKSCEVKRRGAIMPQAAKAKLTEWWRTRPGPVDSLFS